MDYTDYDYTEGYVPEDEEVTEEQKLEWFEESFIRDKDKLISEMEFHRKWVQREAQKDTRHSAAYYAVLDKVFERLINKTEKTRLFDKLEDWWAYSYSISSDGGTVLLEYYYSVDFDRDGCPSGTMIDGSFEVVSAPCHLLSVEEYAKLYGAEPGTVRQWIRRGKIRTAKKYGNEWRIPELSDIPQRGYRMGQYEWEDDLTDVPIEYEFLKRPAIATLYQDDKDPKVYHLGVNRDGKNEHRMLTAQEREKLELFLIAHPLVKFISDLYALYG